MKVLNGQKDATEVISGNGFVESWHLSDHFEHLLSFQIFHQEKNVLLVVESFDKAYYVRKYCLLENLLLLYYTSLHIFIFDRLFRKTFHREQPSSCVHIFHQENLTKLTLTQFPHYLKVNNVQIIISFLNAFLRSPDKFLSIFNDTNDFCQLLKGKNSNTSISIFYQGLPNPISLNPVLHVEDSPFPAVVHATFKGDNKSSELNLFPVYSFNTLKSHDDFVELGRTEVFELITPEQSPFLNVIV